jgi:hypothetical protein
MHRTGGALGIGARRGAACPSPATATGACTSDGHHRQHQEWRDDRSGVHRVINLASTLPGPARARVYLPQMTIPACNDCLRPAYRPGESVKRRGSHRKRCPACRRTHRAWVQRQYWWHRGGAERHKHNGLRRERMTEKASRREVNKELWRIYRMMYVGSDSDWPSFRAAALNLPMPSMPECFARQDR